MSGRIVRVLAAAGIAAAGSLTAVAVQPAAADTGCKLYPLYADVPIHAEATLGSPRVGTLGSSGSQCGTSTAGGSYSICGGGSSWIYARTYSGWVPRSCVERID